MRVLVCGGRDYHNRLAVYRELCRLNQEEGISVIIHGGCRGADQLAAQWVEMTDNCREEVYKPDWSFGLCAGPIRNQRMLDGKPDLVIAFPGGRGTADMVRRAVRAGVKVLRVKP